MTSDPLNWKRFRDSGGVLDEVGPGLDDVEHLVAWTNGGPDLAVGQQLVIFAKLAKLNAYLQQFPARLHLPLGGGFGAKGPYEGDADAVFIIAYSVRTLGVPTAAAVHGVVAAHQKVVADVGPLARLYVERLYESRAQDTITLQQK